VALGDRARSIYTGLIRIDPGAPRSEAYQENRNLLLSDRCRADSIPELEILTDEVSCSHGATVAPIDPQQQFYLASRGVDPVAAIQLIVGGFVAAVTDRLPPAVAAEIADLIAARLARVAGGA
jgi:Fe-S cluster assembly protein SufD